MWTSYRDQFVCPRCEQVRNIDKDDKRHCLLCGITWLNDEQSALLAKAEEAKRTKADGNGLAVVLIIGILVLIFMVGRCSVSMF